MAKQTTLYNSVEMPLKEIEVTLVFEGSIAIISLNRPQKYNAVNQTLINSFNEALELISITDQIRGLVITGVGKGFSAGADIDNFGSLSPEKGRAYLEEEYLPLINSLVSLNMPTIAAVNGTAAGFGASIALACDFRVMAPSSALLFAFINLALGPDGGASWLLARQVGYSKALEIALGGEKIPADICFKLGLANKLTAEKDLLTEAKSWAHQLSQKSKVATKITKQDMLFAMNNDLNTTMKFEAQKQLEALQSEDLLLAVTKFIKKK